MPPAQLYLLYLPTSCIFPANYPDTIPWPQENRQIALDRITRLTPYAGKGLRYTASGFHPTPEGFTYVNPKPCLHR